MKLTTLTLAAASAVGMLAPAQAATTITFDSYVGATCVTTPVVADVLTFTTGFFQCTLGPGNQEPGKADNGTGIFINGYSTGTAVAATAIKLNSLDIGQSYYSGPSDLITITLNLAGGGTSSTIITSVNSFQTVNFGGASITGFTVSGNSGYYALDNITYNAVPESATWAMLIVGFGMVGIAARRRKAAVAA